MNIKLKPNLFAQKIIHLFPSNNVVTDPRFLAVAVPTEYLTMVATVATQLKTVTADNNTKVKSLAQIKGAAKGSELRLVLPQTSCSAT